MNTATKNSNIELWKKILSDVKDDEQLEQYVSEYLGCSLAEILESYDSEKDSQKELIHKLIYENNSANEEDVAYDELFTAVSIHCLWGEFYRPILKNVGKQILKIVSSSNIIEDKDRMSKIIMFSLVEQCFDISFRVVLQEYNYAKAENVFSGSDEEENKTQFNNMLKEPDFLSKLYSSYPELIRLLDIRSEWYISMINDIIGGTEKELENIKAKVNNDIRKIRNIQLTGGDSHKKGRKVCIIEFNDNIKIVYKPRLLDTEAAFESVINYFNDNVKSGDYRRISLFKYHTVDNKGWTEFISPDPCDNMDDVHDFYVKMGEILCILYLLNAKDFHSENIICRKSDPILIDVETLLHAMLFDDMESKFEGANLKAFEIIDKSVMKTCILPTKIINPKTGKSLEIGALGRQRDQEAPFSCIDTVMDENGVIKTEKHFNTIEAKECCPVFEGKRQDAYHFVNYIIDGFESVYKFIHANKEEVIDVITESFASRMNRFVLRPTNIYTQLIKTSCHPHLLRNAWDRKIFFLKILSASESENMTKEIVLTELRDMYNCDVPYYMCSSDALDLIDSEGNIVEHKSMCKTTLLQSAIDHIREMSEHDMMRQSGLICLSFAEDLEMENIFSCNIIEDHLTVSREVIEKDYTIEDYFDRIIQITEEKSVTDEKNDVHSITWIDVNRIPDLPVFVSFMKTGIYSGLSGIYLFFEELNSKTGNEKAREIADKLYIIINSDLKKGFSSGEEDFSGFDGCAGALYALARFGADKALIKEHLNALLDNIDISLLKCTDFLAGNSGIIKVLIYLYKYLDDYSDFDDAMRVKTKEKIAELADDIMVKAEYEGSDKVYWGKEGYTGYAHGVAGMVDSLADYYDFAKDEKVLPFIEYGCNYIEGCRYKNNWARDINRNSVSINWCHGAPGIALMKMRLFELFGEKYCTRNQLEEIKNIIVNNGFGTDYCLCHGDMGNIMILNKLAQTLDDKKVMDLCKEKYKETLSRLKGKLFGDFFYYSEDTSFMLGPQAIGVGILEMEYGADMLDILVLR